MSLGSPYGAPVPRAVMVVVFMQLFIPEQLCRKSVQLPIGV